MAERVCVIVAFSEILISGGIVKGGSPPLCLYPPLTRRNMKRLYKVESTFRKQTYVFYVYAKSECHAFNLFLKHIVELYSDVMYCDPIYISEFTNRCVSPVLNFLK